MTEREKTIHNERTKLLANGIDRASTACLAVGVLGPAVATLYGNGGIEVPHLIIGFGTLSWLAAASVLHLLARWVLGSVR